MKSDNIKTVTDERAQPSRLLKPHVRCDFPDCFNSLSKSKAYGLKIQFYKFPQDDLFKMIWIRRCRKPRTWKVGDHNRVCSEHFIEDDYSRNIYTLFKNEPTKRVLKPGAIPKPKKEVSANVRSRKVSFEDIKEEDSSITVGETLIQDVKIENSLDDSSTKEIIAENLIHEESCVNSAISRKTVQLCNYSSNACKESVNGKNEVSTENLSVSVFMQKDTNGITTSPLKQVENCRNVQIESTSLNSSPSNETQKNLSQETVLVPYDCLKQQTEQANKTIEAKSKQIQRLQKEIKQLKSDRDQHVKYTSILESTLKQFLSPSQYNMVTGRKTKTWWKPEDVFKAVTLWYFSKKCYIYLKEQLKYPLPSVKSVERWVSKLNIKNMNSKPRDWDIQELEESVSAFCGDATPDRRNDPDIAQDPLDNPERISDDDIIKDSEMFEEDATSSAHIFECVSIDHSYGKRPEDTSNSQSRGSLTDIIANGVEEQKKSIAPNSTPLEKMKMVILRHLRQAIKLTDNPKMYKEMRAVAYPCTCKTCNEHLANENAYKRHAKATRHFHNPHPCDHCSKVFPSKQLLTNHKRNMLGSKLCELCGRSFTSVEGLRVHRLRHHAKHIIQGKRTRTRTLAGTVKHSGHMCELCGKMYPTKNIYNCHKRNVHMQAKSKCPVCNVECCNSKIRRHIASHSNSSIYECGFCNITMRIAEKYDRHYIEKHPGMSPNHAVNEELVAYQCQRCSEICPNKQSLVIHFNLSHRGYACEYCETECESSAELASHKASVHENVRDCCCRYCGKSYETWQDVYCHSPMHKYRAFKCDECPRTFENSFKLKRHSLLHNDAHNYACQYCNKKFRHKSSLVVHIRLHTGERPYTCEICGKKLICGSTKGKHMKKHLRERQSPVAEELDDAECVETEI